MTYGDYNGNTLALLYYLVCSTIKNSTDCYDRKIEVLLISRKSILLIMWGFL